MRIPIFVVALLVSGAAHAERPLTYSEALRGAVAANPSLSRTQFSEQEAEASVVAARGTFDPTYSLDASYRNAQFSGIDNQLGFPYSGSNRHWELSNNLSGAFSTGTSYNLSAGLNNDSLNNTVDLGPDLLETEQVQYESNLSASVTQQLLKGVIAKYNLQNVTISRQSYTVAQLSTERSHQETLATAAESYWNWVYQSNLRDIATESVEVAKEALRVGKLKVEAGELAPVEETRLQAALVQAQASALDASNAAEKSANALLLVMGESPDQDVIPATQPGDVPELELDLQAATEVALTQNLEVAVARANLETAELQRTTAKHGRLPTLSATLSAGVSGPSSDTLDETTGRVLEPASLGQAIGNLTGEDSQPFTSIAGNFTVPLGNRAAKGEADRTSFAVYRSRTELEELERSITAQVEEQVRALESARRKVELSDANQELAEVTLRAEEALSEAGRSIQKDVLEARTEVARTKAEATKARTDYRVAQVALLKLQGQLTEQTP